MTKKNLDNHNRWRNRQVAFRLSPEEADLLDTKVRLSGLTKQDYIIKRLLEQKIVVVGNPRIYRMLKYELEDVLDQLRRIEAGQCLSAELLETIQLIAEILKQMKGSDD
jgi:hypothetical protein